MGWFIPALLGAVGGAAAASATRKDPRPVLRDPDAEYEAAYKTQIKYAPGIYESDRQYQPLYTDLELANQERA